MTDDGIAHLWETTTGRERSRLATEPSAVAGFAFSPDGRVLASWKRSRDILLWDLCTGEKVGRLEGHRGAVRGAAFSSAGNRLASASEDTTVLIWQVPTVKDGPVKPAPTLPELEALWVDLAGADTRRAHLAICRLVQTPRFALSLLEGRLQPVAPVDPGRLAKLVAALDSEQLAVRTEAGQELERLHELAEPTLKKVLLENPPLEVRLRVEALLRRLQDLALSPKRLRQIRAIEALEHMGTPESRRLLETLATGAPEALLTKEAKASVERLRGRLAAP